MYIHAEKLKSGLKLTFESRFKTIISQYLIKWGNSLEVLMFLLPRLKKPQSFWTKFWNSGHSASALLSRLTAEPTQRSRKKKSWSWSAKNRQTSLCPASVSRKKRSPVNRLSFWLEVQGCLLSISPEFSANMSCVSSRLSLNSFHFGCLSTLSITENRFSFSFRLSNFSFRLSNKSNFL